MRFSSRLDWDTPENPLTRLLAARRAAGARILDLTVSNPTTAGVPVPAHVLDALAAPGGLVYEPSPRGLPGARAAIADHQARSGIAVAPDDLVLTASTSEAYAYLFKLLCDPGDAVLAPEPSYPLFSWLARLEGVRLRPYPLAWDGAWHVDVPALDAALDAESRVRAILFVSPNNPTGSYLAADDWARLQERCARRGLALVVDEVFAEYPADDAPPPGRIVHAATPDAPALSFGLGGLSKGSGLPQLKLGWIVAGGPASLRASALARLELIADSYLSVGTPVQHAAGRLLAAGDAIRDAIRARVRGNRGWLAARLAGDSPIELLPAEGGWSAILRLPRTRSDEELALALLRDRDTLVHPGYLFDLPPGTFLVVSLLTPAEVFREGVEAILAG